MSWDDEPDPPEEPEYDYEDEDEDHSPIIYQFEVGDRVQVTSIMEAFLMNYGLVIGVIGTILTLGEEYDDDGNHHPQYQVQFDVPLKSGKGLGVYPSLWLFEQDLTLVSAKKTPHQTALEALLGIHDA